MSSKSDFSYFSLIFDDKKVIESTNIKRKVLEIVHEKESDLFMDNQLFDFYLNKNQIIIEKQEKSDFKDINITSRIINL